MRPSGSTPVMRSRWARFARFDSMPEGWQLSGTGGGACRPTAPTKVKPSRPAPPSLDEVSEAEDAAYLSVIRSMREGSPEYLEKFPNGFRAREVQSVLQTEPNFDLRVRRDGLRRRAVTTPAACAFRHTCRSPLFGPARQLPVRLRPSTVNPQLVPSARPVQAASDSGGGPRRATPSDDWARARVESASNSAEAIRAFDMVRLLGVVRPLETDARFEALGALADCHSRPRAIFGCSRL